MKRIFQLFIIFSVFFPSFIPANGVYDVEYFKYFKNPRGFSRYTKFGTGKMRPMVSFVSWEPNPESSAVKNSKSPTKPTVEKTKKQGLVEEKLSPLTVSLQSTDKENKESLVDEKAFSVVSTSEQKKNLKLVEDKASTLQSTEKHDDFLSVEVDSKTFTIEVAQ